MQVQLLGDVAVIGDRGGCRIDAPLSRRCLGALALSSGAVSLHGLADALWGDDPPANWKPALRNVVAKLRRRLDVAAAGGTTLVVTSPTGYRLSPQCTIDVFRSLSDADAADEALTNGDPTARWTLQRRPSSASSRSCYPTSMPTGSPDTAHV